MNKSIMVYATKYKLLIPISQKAGTYRNTGKPEEREKITDKIVARDYVEARNAGMHHEFWIIDEKRTEELFGEDGEQQKNIAKQAIDRQRSNATMGDLIEAMGGKPAVTTVDPELAKLKAKLAKAEAENKELKKVKKEPEPVKETPYQFGAKPLEECTLTELKAYCDDNLIAYHPSTREKGLIKLISESK